MAHLPIGFSTRIRAINGPDGAVAEAFPPMSVVIDLDRDLDVGRGDMLARPNNLPNVTQDIEVMLCWMAVEPHDLTRSYSVLHTTRETRCLVREVRYKIDVSTLHRRSEAGEIGRNDLARVSLRCRAPLF